MTSEPRFIPISEPLIGENELAYVTDCVKSGWISSLGKYIAEFENQFAAFCGVKHAIAVSNGTTAIHLALVAMNIGEGDEVIVPTLTFVATANAVRYTGAKPIFCDSEDKTWNMDVADITRHITPRTKAIIPVHLYGHPVDMGALNELAQKHNLIVLEDAAEAHGARYKDQRVGSMGVLNSFSFYGNKIITTGEGGMLTTNDDALAARCRFLRDHAMSPEKRYWHTEVGFNYRMTNMQAALGVAQMERIEEFINRKRHIAEIYNNELSGLRGLQLPPEAEWASSVYWMYSLVFTDEFPVTRDEVMKKLKAQGIDSRPFFYPVHVLPPYATGQSLPVAERLSRQGINLPSAVTITDEDIRRVARAIRELA